MELGLTLHKGVTAVASKGEVLICDGGIYDKCLAADLVCHVICHCRADIAGVVAEQTACLLAEHYFVYFINTAGDRTCVSAACCDSIKLADYNTVFLAELCYLACTVILLLENGVELRKLFYGVLKVCFAYAGFVLIVSNLCGCGTYVDNKNLLHVVSPSVKPVKPPVLLRFDQNIYQKIII